MRPQPMMPSVLPRSSWPCRDFLSHLPACMLALACAILRAMVIMRPSVSSATAMAFAPGVFITTMPRCVASAAPMLSTPAPARPITRSFGADSSSFLSTCTAERTTRPSASASSAGRSVIWSAVTTFHVGSCFRTASVAGDTFSARTIFIATPLAQTVISRLRARDLLGGVEVDLLRGSKACAVLEARDLERVHRDELQRTNERHGVHVVEEAEVRDAEDLALHLALA